MSGTSAIAAEQQQQDIATNIQSPQQTAVASTSSNSSSPPTSLTLLSTNTTPSQSVLGATLPPPLHATLPSQQAQRQIAEARAAVVATIGNLVDSELQSRATILHENAAALEKQEKDVAKATADLRRETDKLAKEANAAAKKLKEVGNVQNWAEVMERGFVVLEETIRLANGGEDSGSEDGSGSGSGSGSWCSCSDCGRETIEDADSQNVLVLEAMDLDPIPTDEILDDSTNQADTIISDAPQLDDAKASTSPVLKDQPTEIPALSTSIIEPEETTSTSATAVIEGTSPGAS